VGGNYQESHTGQDSMIKKCWWKGRKLWLQGGKNGGVNGVGSAPLIGGVFCQKRKERVKQTQAIKGGTT